MSYKIVRKEDLNPQVFLMEIEAPLVAKKAEPGQFVILRIDEFGERVPFTVSDFDREKGTVTIIIQAVGKTTKDLAAMKAGESILDFAGPLGMPTPLDHIKKAAIIAMYAGADYIKTSTGKLEPAATPEAAYVMCQAIKEYYDKTGIQIGFKPAGGLNSVMDALIYYTIVKEVLGKEWLTNQWFRLGTSRLANLLLSEITGEETKFF